MPRIFGNLGFGSAGNTGVQQDPLEKKVGNGQDLGGYDFNAVPEAQAALANGADVPERVQDGPTCGLYALGMVMDYFEQKNPKDLDPLVQASDANRSNAGTVSPNCSTNLLDEAKQDGFTTQGEMFYASQLADLAKQYGYHATVKDGFTVQDLKDCVDRGHPALVPFDVDNVGNPGLYDGKRAHWAVVEGTFEKNGVDYVVATHGWEGKEYVWRAQDLVDSSDQLHDPDFTPAPKDIGPTLAGKMVEVSDA